MREQVKEVALKMKKLFFKKMIGGTKEIIIEILLLLLAVGAVLLYKNNITDTISSIIESCKATINSIIG